MPTTVTLIPTDSDTTFTQLKPNDQATVKTSIEGYIGGLQPPKPTKGYTGLVTDLSLGGKTGLAAAFTVTEVDGDNLKVTVDSVSENNSPTSLPVKADPLAGAKSLTGDVPHYGIAVVLASDGKTSVLTIPDVGKVKQGGGDVFITKPINLKLEKLQKFLEKKGVTLPEQVNALLKSTEISCDAFFYRSALQGGKGKILLMVFSINFTQGLIGALTGDKDLGSLFEIQGASLRVFQCSEADFHVLESYAAELRGETAPAPATTKSLPAAQTEAAPNLAPK
jgi:hypothetical protein